MKVPLLGIVLLFSLKTRHVLHNGDSSRKIIAILQAFILGDFYQAAVIYLFAVLNLKGIYCIYKIIMQYIHFAWDDQKNQANIREHGVSFEEAQTAFYDPKARIIYDPDHSQEEDRFVLLGVSRKMRILVIPHTYRENDEIVRIISARKTLKNEQRQYENLGGV